MKIAFCKFAGLANGGTEKYLQSIAMLYQKNGHDVEYFYTNAAPILNQDWQHPPNDKNREDSLITAGVKITPIFVEARIRNEWINSNFFDKFSESKYDVLITAGNGESEYPYNRLHNIPIIHTIHGEHAFSQKNIKKSVLLCNWQAEKWVNNGGEKNKLEIIPSYVPVPSKYGKEFRLKNKIPPSAFVYGFHQRNDPSIFSPVSLEAFKLQQKENEYFAILGGSDKHKDFVRQRNISNVIFVEYTSLQEIIHEFLDGIDVYAHSRSDGEVCSASIIEALYHGKPVISVPGINMGHKEQIQDCGFMCSNIEEYIEAMRKIKQDIGKFSRMAKVKYYTDYSATVVEQKLLKLL
jgi:glycosyltransferase involved in cell wall biosynthesis